MYEKWGHFMMVENKGSQEKPEEDELRVMLHEMINEPIQQHISTINKRIDEAFSDVLLNLKSIYSLVKKAKEDASKANDDFVELAEDAWKKQRDSLRNWVEEARQRTDNATELTKSSASCMNATAKRHGHILSFVLVLTVLNTLAVAALLWFHTR